MKVIPIGIENFKDLMDKDAYYIDKTNFIEDVLKENVALYTRPRRFGKTLNMSMLYYFFSIKEKENRYLFNNLNIAKNKEVLKYQNKYPTIFISLKEMKMESFEKQIIKFKEVISFCSKKFLELLESPYLIESEKELFTKYVDKTANKIELERALLNLSYYLNMSICLTLNE